jgi:hypothetical protein
MPRAVALVCHRPDDNALRCWRAPTLAEIDAAEAKEKAESKQP